MAYSELNRNAESGLGAAAEGGRLGGMGRNEVIGGNDLGSGWGINE